MRPHVLMLTPEEQSALIARTEVKKIHRVIKNLGTTILMTKDFRGLNKVIKQLFPEQGVLETKSDSVNIDIPLDDLTKKPLIESKSNFEQEDDLHQRLSAIEKAGANILREIDRYHLILVRDIWDTAKRPLFYSDLKSYLDPDTVKAYILVEDKRLFYWDKFLTKNDIWETSHDPATFLSMHKVEPLSRLEQYRIIKDLEKFKSDADAKDISTSAIQSKHVQKMKAKKNMSNSVSLSLLPNERYGLRQDVLGSHILSFLSVRDKLTTIAHVDKSWKRFTGEQKIIEIFVPIIRGFHDSLVFVNWDPNIQIVSDIFPLLFKIEKAKLHSVAEQVDHNQLHRKRDLAQGITSILSTMLMIYSIAAYLSDDYSAGEAKFVDIILFSVGLLACLASVCSNCCCVRNGNELLKNLKSTQGVTGKQLQLLQRDTIYSVNKESTPAREEKSEFPEEKSQTSDYQML